MCFKHLNFFLCSQTNCDGVFHTHLMFPDLWTCLYHGVNILFIYCHRCHKCGVVTEIFCGAVMAVLLRHSPVVNMRFTIHHKISFD